VFLKPKLAGVVTKKKIMKTYIFFTLIFLFKCIKISQCQSPISMGNLKVSGEDNSNINSLEKINDKLFFAQQSNPLSPSYFTNPWSSDGTTVGTIQLTPAIMSSNSRFLNLNNTTYFFDSEGLKKTDGSIAGTILIKPGISPTSIEKSVLSLNNLLFFVNSVDNKLWKSDGTAAGTVVVKDINSPTFIRNLSAAGGLVFFVAEDNFNGVELWRSDGTEVGTSIVKDVFQGINGSYPTELTSFNNQIYFNASKSFADGTTLWRSDGTNAGTIEITTLDGSYSPVQPKNFTEVGNSLYFTSVDFLWKTDGTVNGAVQFGSFVAPDNINAQRITSIYNSNGILYLSTRSSNESEASNLFTSDGTLSGTIFLKKLKLPNKLLFGTDKKQYSTLNGIFYFSANEGENGFELWKSDGTTAGTVLVKNINEGRLDSNPLQMNFLGNKIYFFANTYSQGYELWTSDGTEVGTFVVKDIQENNFHSNPTKFLQIGANVYFAAETKENANLPELMFFKTNIASVTSLQSSFGRFTYPNNFTNFNNQLFFNGTQFNDTELFKSDGTSQNTTRVRDINAGNSSSNPDFLTVSNTTMFFAATTALNGRELWKTDGTEAGTVLVKDIFPSTIVASPSGPITTVNSCSPFRLSNHNGVLYFGATTLAGTELWKSDGTETNTVMVNDINIDGSGLSSLSEIKSTPNTLFFTANNSTLGTELWKIDASNPNGVIIKDISVGSSSSNPTYLTSFGNSIYFSAATQGFDGRELWKSDGTSAGTLIVRNIAGNNSSNPTDLTICNGLVYFTADDYVNGRELWRSDGTFSGTVMLKDIHPSAASDPKELCVVNNTLYFSADDGVHGRELWKTDGTTEGTVLAFNHYDEIYDDPLVPKKSSNPTSLYSFNNVLYFGANSGKLGNEPYRFTPCTLASTNLVKTAYLPSQSLNTTQTITAANKLNVERKVNYFAGNSITLTPGFRASASIGDSNIFRAEIRACY
jgi:ELWxxDGT repeat protein